MTKQFMRLKEVHPTAQKIDKLFAFMEELGLQIIVAPYVTAVSDKDFPHDVFITDMERVEEPVHDFPPTFEYILRYENPKYVEEQKKRQEIVEAEAKAIKDKRRLEEEERKRKIEEEFRNREIAEFERLKNKYG